MPPKDGEKVRLKEVHFVVNGIQVVQVDPNGDLRGIFCRKTRIEAESCRIEQLSEVGRRGHGR